MRTTLYGIPLSHPVASARLMLAHKGLEVRERTLIAGMHPLLLAAAGFRPTTVPAVRLATRRRVQGSLAIAAALEEAYPPPAYAPLYPQDPDLRAAVQEAEQWGERELQPVPRRIIRRHLSDSHALRIWFAREATPFPAPRATAVALAPTARLFARFAGASRTVAAQDEQHLDNLLDRVDDLVETGVIGATVANAADFQIAPSVRSLAAFGHLRKRVAAHPAAWDFAHRVVPEFPAIPT